MIFFSLKLRVSCVTLSAEDLIKATDYCRTRSESWAAALPLHGPLHQSKVSANRSRSDWMLFCTRLAGSSGETGPRYFYEISSLRSNVVLLNPILECG